MKSEDVKQYIISSKPINTFKFFLENNIQYTGTIDFVWEESISITDKFGNKVLIELSQIINILTVMPK